MPSLRLIVPAFWALASSAHATPPLIIPAEPARLAAAKQLAAALPLGDAFGGSLVARDIESNVAESALSWLAQQKSKDRYDSVKQLFYDKVRIQSHSHLIDAINDLQAPLSEKYARWLSEYDLKATQTFSKTPEGSAFLKLQLGGDTKLQSLVVEFLYKRTFPDFPHLLKSACESSRLLDRVNRKR